MDRIHLTQLKFYKSDIDNSKRSFNYSFMLNMSTSSICDGVNLAWDADH